MGLGRRLTELRTGAGESLQQTADAVGASKAHIWQVERGKADNPGIALVTKLAEHFRVSVGFLLGEDIDAGDADGELASMFRQAQQFTPQEREILRGMVNTLIKARPKGTSG